MTAADRRDDDGTQRVNMARSYGSSPDDGWTAADRPSVPRVGDTITNPDQLDALPVGVVMRARNDLLTETGRLGADGMRVVWGEGWSDHAAAIEHLAPLTVLYVPGEPSRPSVTDDARAVREAAMNLYRAMRRANPDAWAEVDEVEDWAYWEDIVRTAQVTLAAGRAETTTEEWPRCKASRDGGCARCHDEHGRHVHCRAETTTALPRPGDGCQCTWHNEDRGGGHYELVAEYEPACPEHSEHVWNPRTGMWEHRAETTIATTEDAETLAATYLEGYVLSLDAAREHGRAITKSLADAGLLATARTRPTETTTEWGRRAEGYQDWIADPKYVDDPKAAAEESARLTGGAVIRREVTAWTEADQ